MKYLQFKREFPYGFIVHAELNKFVQIEKNNDIRRKMNIKYVQEGLPVFLDLQEIKDRSS